MEEIHKLRAQISSIVQTNFPALETGFVSNLRPPNNLQVNILVVNRQHYLCTALAQNP